MPLPPAGVRKKHQPPVVLKKTRHLTRRLSCIRGYVGGLSKRVSLHRVVKLAGWDNAVMGAILCTK